MSGLGGLRRRGTYVHALERIELGEEIGHKALPYSFKFVWERYFATALKTLGISHDYQVSKMRIQVRLPTYLTSTAGYITLNTPSRKSAHD